MWVLSTLLLLLLALLVAVAGSSSWQLSSGGIICCCCCGSDKVRWYILCLWQPSLKWRPLVVGPAAATTVAASATSAAAAVEQDSGGRKKGEREKREKTGSRLWIWVVLGLHLPACLPAFCPGAFEAHRDSSSPSFCCSSVFVVVFFRTKELASRQSKQTTNGPKPNDQKRQNRTLLGQATRHHKKRLRMKLELGLGPTCWCLFLSSSRESTPHKVLSTQYPLPVPINSSPCQHYRSPLHWKPTKLINSVFCLVFFFLH